jgi:TIR domain
MPKSSSRRRAKKRTSNKGRAEYVKIEALGARCWLDEKDLEGGNVIADEILRGIDACKEGIVLISPNSLPSQWIAFEIGGIRAQHKRVTPKHEVTS